MMTTLRVSSHNDPFTFVQKRCMSRKYNENNCKTEACRRLPKCWERGKKLSDAPHELYASVKKVEPALELQKAIKANNIVLMQQLLDSGVDTSKRVDGISPIFLALNEGAQEAMRVLLCHGAPVSPHTEEEINIFKAAVQKDAPDEKKLMAELIGLVSSTALAIITPRQE